MTDELICPCCGKPYLVNPGRIATTLRDMQGGPFGLCQSCIDFLKKKKWWTSEEGWENHDDL